MKLPQPAWLATLRERLAARPDTEHEQALVRIAVGVVLFFYLLPAAVRADSALGTDLLYLAVMFGYLTFSVLVFAGILQQPGTSALRRLASATVDIGTITFFMSQSGVHAVPMFLLYVWVTLANGFRFGPRYLMFALGASIAGFSVVLAVDEFWSQNRTAGFGLAVAFIALSVYVRSLVKRMFDAVARAEAANQAKRRFISVVSHEMRTPLNAIIGMADLMRDTQLTREQADMLQTLRGSSQVMLGLVEDVLDFSKIEAGKLVLERTDFDLHALVNSTSRILQAQAQAKHVEFVVSIMPEVPPALRGDAHHLRQVLINLAGNAVKFTERGTVTVHVSLQEETEAGVRLKFSVRDTGVGIPPEAQERIFDSFTQADQSTTRRFGGTGLGTTIAKQLVELMGGRIGLESAVGLGSTFWFEVAFEMQPERASAPSGELAGARMLLVGFPPARAEPVEQALASWGALAVRAAGIEEAADRLVADIALAKPYHSVLAYSESGDVQLARRLRRAAPEPAPPLVLSVPREADVQRFAALSAGFGAVLELPAEKRQLFNVLHSISSVEEARDGVVRLQDYAKRDVGARRLQVLVADDNPTNREVLGRILERAGHSTTLVADGDLALDALEAGQFDAVLLDRNMPNLSGLETLRAIRLMTRGRERLPVVILSADVTVETKRECLEAGADSFVPKPVEALRLLDELRTLTADKGKEAARAAPLPAAIPAASADEVINADTLSHLNELGSSPDFLERLVSVFVADSLTLLAKMESAIAARNFGEFRSHLHAMKGSAASIGTERLTRLCSSLGKQTDAELRLKAAGVMRSLNEEFEQGRAALERYVQDARSQSAS
ncbi:MAG: ATP-binding protein [Betaproteobacteria bacterium]|nr:ATP-binding protein [Betaproteobacteria bacterium]MDH5221007.1 ATP-binding protein [Betaproteobacteria bacterium]MDH5350282.1 ATP-binding protein [Betaproteobacteria bacterium]